jgi:hypothetical protein
MNSVNQHGVLSALTCNTAQLPRFHCWMRVDTVATILTQQRKHKEKRALVSQLLRQPSCTLILTAFATTNTNQHECPFNTYSSNTPAFPLLCADKHSDDRAKAKSQRESESIQGVYYAPSTKPKTNLSGCLVHFSLLVLSALVDPALVSTAHPAPLVAAEEPDQLIQCKASGEGSVTEDPQLTTTGAPRRVIAM